MAESRQRVYLDHAASTPLRPEAVAALQDTLSKPLLMANPSSNHADGRSARAQLECLRELAAHFFNARPEDVVFNSGGSEGDTQALLGFAELLNRPIHLAISAIEHEAVQMTAQKLRRTGHLLSVIPVTSYGIVDLEFTGQLLHSNPPDLLSVMAVNNETGVVQPVPAIAAMCAGSGTVFHCDAVRAVGHGLGEVLTDSGVSLINCSAHKFGGPRGVGILVQRGIRLPPLVCGGGQEGGSRAGTENVAGVFAMMSALTQATNEEAERIEQLRLGFERDLLERFPFVEIHGSRARRATHITYASFAPLSGQKLQASLDRLGFSVSTGSACHDDGSVTISPVLQAMGVAELSARGTLRISMGWNTTAEDLESLLDALDQLVNGPASAELNCEV